MCRAGESNGREVGTTVIEQKNLKAINKNWDVNLGRSNSKANAWKSMYHAVLEKMTTPGRFNPQQ